jgi:HEAT repeat protein
VITAEEAERRAARLEELQAEILAQVEDPDPATRAEAARWLQPGVEGLAIAERLLAADPSPDVRAAAAESLADGDSVGAVSLLLGALDDPDPRVVMAALDALEFAGDATIIPALSPLLQHRDVAVRERTIEAIEFLE